jgi:4-diphosphocytidyl-2-C-methyl-D-erythritol kinase
MHAIEYGGRLSLLARAKVNLFLRVFPGLVDGRHRLESVFASISLSDSVDLELRDGAGTTLHTEFDFDCPPEENLCVKAATLYLSRASAPGGVDLNLRKEIPAFSGLGGGSADAAAVLAGLDTLHQGLLGPERLLSAAGELGSDVPFCLEGGLALVRGTGEQLERLAFSPALHLLVVKPPCCVSTAWAYRALDSFPDKAGEPDLPGLLAALERSDAAGVATRLFNSFEPVVEAHYPPIRMARELLLAHGALGARLTGSGAAVYGIFAGERECEEAAAVLGARYPAWPCTLEPRGLAAADAEGDD